MTYPWLRPPDYPTVARFKVGDRARIARIYDSDTLTSRALIGRVGVITEIDPLVNGQFNFDLTYDDGLGGHYAYVNDYMLDPA